MAGSWYILKLKCILRDKNDEKSIDYWMQPRCDGEDSNPRVCKQNGKERLYSHFGLLKNFGIDCKNNYTQTEWSET